MAFSTASLSSISLPNRCSTPSLLNSIPTQRALVCGAVIELIVVVTEQLEVRDEPIGIIN
jgi:hypothetical protein